MDIAHHTPLDNKPLLPHSRLYVIDAYIGSRIRLRRRLLGMSQDQFGKSLGVSFQQVQKYEQGTNRVGASRIYDISCLLDTPIAFFYEGLPTGMTDQRVSALAVHEPEPFTRPSDFGSETTRPITSMRQELLLLRFFNGIADPAVRGRVLELVKAISSVS